MAEPTPPAARFPTTRWSRVLAAAGRSEPDAGAALAELCAADWYPVNALIRHSAAKPQNIKEYSPQRHRDHREESFDLAQLDNLAHRARIRKLVVQEARPRRGRRPGPGRFRPPAREGHPGRRRPEQGPLTGFPPHRLRLLPGRRPRPRGPMEARRRGHPDLHRRPRRRGALPRRAGRRADARAALRPRLGRGPARAPPWPASPPSTPGRAAPGCSRRSSRRRCPGRTPQPYAAIAERLVMTEAAVQQAASRLRRRYRARLRAEAAATLREPDEAAVEDEIRDLIASLAR